MIVKEFLCVHEYGTVIFHRRYYKHEEQDIILRSGLISALFNYAGEVENDSINEIKMERVTLVFKKKELLIFVLFLDPYVKTDWCQYELDYLVNQFFKKYPEVIWQTEIINLARFETFKEEADLILGSLNKKLNLILLLINEGLITELEYNENDLETLGTIVGSRFIEKNYDSIQYALSQNEDLVLNQIDESLIRLSGDHIERSKNQYLINCDSCFLCVKGKKDCFFEGFLKVLLSNLNVQMEIKLI